MAESTGEQPSSPRLQSPASCFRAAGQLLVQHVRKGRDGGDQLFLLPGFEESVDQLMALADEIAADHDIHIVSQVAGSIRQPRDLMQVAETIARAIQRAKDGDRPFQLVGFSEGGVLAFEVAHQLRAARDPVSKLFLVDSMYDERYWPIRCKLAALGGRIRLPFSRMAQRLGSLRLDVARNRDRAITRRWTDINATTVQSQTGGLDFHPAIRGYRPAFYNGVVALVTSVRHRTFNVDPARIWEPLAAQLQVHRLLDESAGSDNTDSKKAVAHAIDRRLWLDNPTRAGLRPLPGFERPLIVTTMRWFSAARLANSLVDAGFIVSACRPRSHPLDTVDGLTSVHTVNPIGRARSIARAIKLVRPDIVLPDDERSLLMLRRLYETFRDSDPEIAGMLLRSLGKVDIWPVLASRTELAIAARASSLQVPATTVIQDEAALRRWVDEYGLPAVLKTDGSWGGRGVVTVRNEAELSKGWRRIAGPPNMVKVLKRLLLDLEADSLISLLTGGRPIVNAQRYVEGREGIATVACLAGQVLTMVCLEVVEKLPNLGAATVVKVTDNRAMVDATKVLVQQLGLSGFCGFDYILNDAGDPVLLELNPRVTPTAYMLAGSEVGVSRKVTLFPADLPRGGVGVATVDVPDWSPAMVEFGARTADRSRSLASRVERRLTSIFSGQTG